MHFTKLRYKQRLLASIGHNVQLQFDHVVPAQSKHYHYNREFFKRIIIISLKIFYANQMLTIMLPTYSILWA